MNRGLKRKILSIHYADGMLLCQHLLSESTVQTHLEITLFFRRVGSSLSVEELVLRTADFQVRVHSFSAGCSGADLIILFSRNADILTRHRAKPLLTQVAYRSYDSALADPDVVCYGLVTLLDHDERLRVTVLLKVVRQIETDPLLAIEIEELPVEAGVAIKVVCDVPADLS